MWQKVIIGLVIWAQTCLALGVALGVLSFREFISIQVSLIMLLLPSPILKRDNDLSNER